MRVIAMLADYAANFYFHCLRNQNSRFLDCHYDDPTGIPAMGMEETGTSA